MFLQNDHVIEFSAPFYNSDCLPATPAKEEAYPHFLEVDGTGKLRIVNTGGSSAAEGGMGSGSDNEKEKGDLTSNMDESTGSNKTVNDPNKSWDPIKENIDEQTNKTGSKE